MNYSERGYAYGASTLLIKTKFHLHNICIGKINDLNKTLPPQNIAHKVYVKRVDDEVRNLCVHGKMFHFSKKDTEYILEVIKNNCIYLNYKFL